MRYVLNHQPVRNLGKWIEFTLDNDRLLRRLVITASTLDELSLASQVGIRLANAKPGDQFEIAVKGEDESIVGEVLSVGDDLVNRASIPSLAQAAA